MTRRRTSGFEITDYLGSLSEMPMMQSAYLSLLFIPSALLYLQLAECAKPSKNSPKQRVFMKRVAFGEPDIYLRNSKAVHYGEPELFYLGFLLMTNIIFLSSQKTSFLSLKLLAMFSRNFIRASSNSSLSYKSKVE